MSLHWPVRLTERRPQGDTLELRGLARGDRVAWERLRARNADWLRPWEATLPEGPEPPMSFRALRRGLDRLADAGHALPFVITVDGVLVGQMHLFDIVWGSRRTASAGYWLDRFATGHGVATWALAMLIDHAIHEAGLHRVEVTIRPENTASLAVVRRLELPEEGFRAGLVHVDGDWRDHLGFAITAEQLGSRRMVQTLRDEAAGG